MFLLSYCSIHAFARTNVAKMVVGTSSDTPRQAKPKVAGESIRDVQALNPFKNTRKLHLWSGLSEQVPRFLDLQCYPEIPSES